jgi:hypothetical protein
MSPNRPAHVVTRSIRRRLGRLLKIFAAVAGVGGIVVIGLQAMWWFQNGFWSPKSLLDLWLWLGNSYTINASARADRIGLWLLGLPLGPTLLVAGLALFGISRGVDP